MNDAAAEGAGGNGTPGTGGGGGGNGGGGAGGATTSMTCQDIRVCTGLANTEADVQACIAKGTAAAQQAFGALQTCLTTPPANCASSLDLNCVCMEECLADGYCMAAAETCRGGATTDLFCDGPCTP